MTNQHILHREDIKPRNDLVPSWLLLKAINTLKPYSGRSGTEVRSVNWRKDQYQIKVEWNNRSSLMCYLNFFSPSDRDYVHSELFKKHAGPTPKSYHDDAIRWPEYRFNFLTTDLLTINEMASIADEACIKYTVLYVQECPSARPLFELMGIPLVAGEAGKELIDGEIKPYSNLTGMCL